MGSLVNGHIIFIDEKDRFNPMMNAEPVTESFQRVLDGWKIYKNLSIINTNF